MPGAANRHASSVIAEVVVLDGEDSGRGTTLAVGADPILLGGAPGAGLRLRDPRIRPRHARISWSGEAFRVSAIDDAPVLLGDARLLDAWLPVSSRVRLGGVLVELRVGLPPDDVRAALRREGLVYASSEMGEVAARVGRIAPFSSSVLVEGETGTGKEVVAQAIHRMSLRHHGPFVIVDCGAVSPSVLESELFGHERGAFTGAEKRRPGAFERAHGGTLFLDEIGELPLHHQPSLLGVLQRRAFRRVGGSEDVQVDVRVLAATNRTLSVEVEKGRFRRDLFFRLSTLTLRLPPLRERLDDLEPLVAHFFADLTGAEPPALPSSILAELRRHRWTGNVRELRAIVERALVHGSWDLGDGAGPIATPPSETTSSSAPGPPLGPVPPATASQLHPALTYAEAKSRAASAFERSYLEELIRRCRGNASEASRIARLDRPHLLRLLRKHSLR